MTMKLCNKKTGEIREFGYLQNDYGKNLVLTVDNGKETVEMFAYNSLAGLNAEWEDYIPKQPLIKDKYIRKVVRDWAKMNAIDRVEYSIFNHPDSYRFEYNSYEDSIAIDFIGRIPELKKEGSYTIEELCGEEE